MPGRAFRHFVLFAFLSLPLAGQARALGLACNATAIDFESPLTDSFSIDDMSSSGVAWTDLNGCGLSNYTGGSGSAACLAGASSSSSVVETSLTSSPFELGCQASVGLHFLLNLQRSSPEATLFLEISSDNGLSWSTLQTWQEQVGVAFDNPGEEIFVDLSAFSFSGPSYTRLRWRYAESVSGASTANWYVQIDDVRISCTETPRADISVQTLGSRGPVIEGAIQQLTFIARNLGPAVATSFQLVAALPNGVQLLSASSSVGTIEVLGNSLFVNAGEITLGAEFELRVSAKLASAAMGSGPQATMLFSSSVQSATCDLLLSNNGELFDVAVLRDWDGDGAPDVSDLCPTDRDRTEPGVRGCLAPLSRNIRQIVKVLDGMLSVLKKVEAGTAKKKHVLKFQDLSRQFVSLTRQSTQNLVSSQGVATLSKQLSQYKRLLLGFSLQKPAKVSKAFKLADKIRLQIIRG